MTTSPGDFNIVGGNCATHASATARRRRGKQDDSWMDTPDNLSSSWSTAAGGRVVSYTGYIGFRSNPSGATT
jgi:hypothetical protein